MIDHGNAFDQEFDPAAFMEDHAFREVRDFWNQLDHRDRWENSIHSAMEKLQERWDLIPREWLDNGSTIELSQLLKTLERVFDDRKTFWQPFEA